jgi:hypothetical protein
VLSCNGFRNIGVAFPTPRAGDRSNSNAVVPAVQQPLGWPRWGFCLPLFLFFFFLPAFPPFLSTSSLSSPFPSFFYFSAFSFLLFFSFCLLFLAYYYLPSFQGDVTHASRGTNPFDFWSDPSVGTPRTLAVSPSVNFDIPLVPNDVALDSDDSKILENAELEREAMAVITSRKEAGSRSRTVMETKEPPSPVPRRVRLWPTPLASSHIIQNLTLC